MTKFESVGGPKVPFARRSGNYIGGDWLAPVNGRYFENTSPINGQVLCEVARSDFHDVEMALDAAHTVRGAWGRTSPAQRSLILYRIADRMEENLDLLAMAQTLDNGKPIRETLAADVPLAIDHFRYFAAAIRAQEGAISQLDRDIMAYHVHEPLGVIGQIIPWTFPLLMACWKLAPALAAGNCVVLKPAEQTPAVIMLWADLVGDLLPAGVLNIVNGYGTEAGAPLASSARVAKIAFSGEAETARRIMRSASENLVPVALDIGRKSPSIFFSDVADEEDAFFDKAVEGFVMFALNQGEACSSPSRAFVHESIYDRFMERAIARTEAIVQGDPLDPATMLGAQASAEQLARILAFVDIGRKEGAEILAGGERNVLPGALASGYYMKPTILRGHKRMRIFQEEVFGPVVSVTTFKDDDEVLEIANEPPHGLGAGIWTRDGTRAYSFGRALRSDRVWTNRHNFYPAHAAFGGHKQSGVGRDAHKAILNQYQRTKNMLVSYSPEKLGFF